MNFKYCNYRQTAVLLLVLLFTTVSMAQRETSKWKFQIAFGFNYADVDGFINGYEAKPVNFPTINLGIQHMFTNAIGAKVDFGYNRFNSADTSPEFKNNYTRFNAQLVYDATSNLTFLPKQIGLFAHIGPGISFTKPLGNLIEKNKETFMNVLGGLEIHYGISESVSIFTDVSYIYSLAGDKVYDPISEGFGTFSGNVFTVTLGVSVSLSGCYYCE